VAFLAVLLGDRRLVELYDRSPVTTHQRTQAQP